MGAGFLRGKGRILEELLVCFAVSALILVRNHHSIGTGTYLNISSKSWHASSPEDKTSLDFLHQVSHRLPSGQRTSRLSQSPTMSIFKIGLSQPSRKRDPALSLVTTIRYSAR